MNSYLDGLNEGQREAALFMDGYKLIIAGAGTGKTKTLVSRVAHLIDSGVAPENILLVTFTNKAAKEMKSRLVSFVGPLGQQVEASTFHSFARNFLRGTYNSVGLKPDFQVIDEPDATEIMRECRDQMTKKLKNLNVDPKSFPKTGILRDIFSLSVNYRLNIHDAVLVWEDKYDKKGDRINGFESECVEVIEEFIEEKASKDRLDYDDLMKYLLMALDNEDIRKAANQRYKYVMCDEYQDTNVIQDMILDRLTEHSGNLVVVGDDNQSIYKFRGAEIENIRTFCSRYGDCGMIHLVENYRSSSEIIDLCNEVMVYAEEGIPKRLHAQFSSGRRPLLRDFQTKDGIASYVAWEVSRLHDAGVPYQEIAIMARSGSETDACEFALDKAGIPYKKFGGTKFKDRATVLYLLSMMRIISDPNDDIAWKRVLNLIDGIGKSYASKIITAVSEGGLDQLNSVLPNKSFHRALKKLYVVLTQGKSKPLPDMIRYFYNRWYEPLNQAYLSRTDLKESTMDSKIAAMKDAPELMERLADMSLRYRSIRSFMEDLALDATDEDEDGDFVNVTTIHSAKGLEYEVVFLLNTIEGCFPKVPLDGKVDPEELRCLYVAMTRAKNRLDICIPSIMPDRNVGPGITRLSRYLDHPNVLACFNDQRSISCRSSHRYW